MLQDELIRLKNSDAYPLHMPGHKRAGTNTGDGDHAGPSPLDEARKIDITEIEGYDNLYDAQGILKEAMDHAGQVYGCPNTFYLVNGSTVGILTAIQVVAAMYRTDPVYVASPVLPQTSPTPRGERRGLLIASNCHRSVSAGAELAGLTTDIIEPEPVYISGLGLHNTNQPLPTKEFIQPEPSKVPVNLQSTKASGTPQSADPSDSSRFTIPGAVSATVIEEKLSTARAEGSDYNAVVITSPTYEGIISDIASIADVCHKYDTVLIVDEAHGAHLDLNDGFPDGALRGGADIVIHSTHKTLASLTQTALMHVQGDLVDITKVTKYLTMLQTSSPSYILMASIDDAIHHITEHPDLVDTYLKRYEKLISSLTASDDAPDEYPGQTKQADTCNGLSHLKILTPDDLAGHGEIRAYDPCKLVVFPVDTDVDGYRLSHILHDEYHIDMEMAAEGYALAILTYMDSEEAFERLARALREIDDRLGSGYYNMNGESAEGAHRDIPDEKRVLYAPCIPRK